MVKHVCESCKDTHKMTIQRGPDEQEVMCTACPVPCKDCQGGGFKAFCASTPCACSCHNKKRPGAPEAQPVATYEAHLLALHIEMKEGRGEGAKAEALRAQMDDSWRRLGSHEQELTDHLSEDLYILEGERRVVKMVEGETEFSLKVNMVAHLQHQDPAEALECARKIPLTPGVLIGFAACWRELGFAKAADQFEKKARDFEEDEPLQELNEAEKARGGK